MKPFSNRVRVTLGGLVALVLAVEIWWLNRSRPTEEQLFSLRSTPIGVRFSDEGRYPLFSQDQESWFMSGKRLKTLEPYVEEIRETPDGNIGRAVIVRLHEPATANDVRNALLSLVDQEICHAGIIDSASRDMSGMREVNIFEIEWVRSSAGSKRECLPAGD